MKLSKISIGIFSVLLAVVVVGWFSVGKKAQNNMGVKQAERQAVKEDSQKKDQDNIIIRAEDELWKEVQKNVKYKQYHRKYFSINNVDDGETVAIGSYHNKVGGANIFAYKYNNKWTIVITQEAISCKTINKLTSEQLNFIKRYIKECVQFNSTGTMHKRIL